MEERIIDVNEMREPDISLYGLAGADDVYTIYYDETNNIRRLHVRPDGLNVKEPACFVLGGIAHRGTVKDLEFQSLRTALRLQPSTKEIKLEHVAKGDLLRILDSAKMEVFLGWLVDRGLFIHYFVLDPLYWSIVDVVDSIVAEHGAVELMMIAPNLKNDLYTVLRYDLAHTVDLFQRYEYPNVGAQRRASFIAELLELVEYRRGLMPVFSFQMLKGLLEIARGLDSLPFLEGETPNVLIDRFAEFFIKRICLFKNSAHILDVEEVVKRQVDAETFVDDGKPLRNFRFAVSDDEPGIQISDIAVGLLGKLFTFINATDSEELEEVRSALSARQARNLASLSALLDRSVEENAAFAHYVISLEDQHRSSLFLGQEA